METVLEFMKLYFSIVELIEDVLEFMKLNFSIVGTDGDGA